MENYTIDETRYFFRKDGVYSKYFGRKLKGHKTVDGYVLIGPICTDGKQHWFYYHKVIWEYFNGEVPEGLQINHIDENKENNCLWNLELLTPKDNCNYGNRTSKNIANRASKRTVYQYSLDGKLINIFNSVREAEKITGFCCSNISKACRGKFKTYKGYRWSYEPL